MSFNINNKDYDIKTDGEFATILSYFDKDFILSLVDGNMKTRFKPFNQTIPNIVYSTDLQFTDKKEQFPDPDKIAEIDIVRNDIYLDIIERICIFYNLEFIRTEETDLYSVAFFLYDFFVSNFTVNLAGFLTRYIIAHKNDIYTAMNLVEFKKSKDASTLYSKKMYDDPQTIAITANIMKVVANVAVFDISLDEILRSTFTVPVYNFISNSIRDRGDFFKVYYGEFCNPMSDFNPLLITMLKLELQKHLETQPVVIISPEEGN